jgi:hypothetical protein
MTSNTFRQSRRNRKGGFSTAFYNAASASILPAGLLLSQQWMKGKTNKNKKFRQSKSFKRFKSRRR